MVTIYKNRKDFPRESEYVELNDLFFNKNTALLLDNYARDIVKQIDAAELISKYKIKSKFNDVVLDVDCLSTGCKTVLNVFYHPDKIFCFKECGDNALEALYSLKHGNIYSDYAIIPIEMEEFMVSASAGKGCRIITDYVELKEWWEHEE